MVRQLARSPVVFVRSSDELTQRYAKGAKGERGEGYLVFMTFDLPDEDFAEDEPAEAPAAEAPKAEEQRTVQYYEMFGNRGIYYNNDWTGKSRRGAVGYRALAKRSFSPLGTYEISLDQGDTLVVSGSTMGREMIIELLRTLARRLETHEAVSSVDRTREKSIAPNKPPVVDQCQLFIENRRVRHHGEFLAMMDNHFALEDLDDCRVAGGVGERKMHGSVDLHPFVNKLQWLHLERLACFYRFGHCREIVEVVLRPK